jgi:hypothetical protein
MADDHDDGDLIRRLEHARLRALVARDLATAESLHAADYELVTPSGGVITRDGYLGGIATGELEYRMFDVVSDITVRYFGRAAVARYRARIEVVFGGQVDTDEFWHTDLYERRTDGWQVVWSQATRIRDG